MILWIICIFFEGLLPVVYADTFIDIPLAEDTYIEEKFPDVSPWNNRNLFIGTDTWYSKGKNRILLKPDLAILSRYDVRESDISAAELHAVSYLYEGSNSSAFIDSYTTSSPWSMYSVTWGLQPSITSKKDSTSITTSSGRKFIGVTNAVLDIIRNQGITSKGLLLKMNPETDKGLVFWAHGCDIAPQEPRCAGESERPYIRIFYAQNEQPTLCKLKAPVTGLVTNSTAIYVDPNISTDPENQPVTYLARVCKETNCSEIHWQGTVYTTKHTELALPESEYYFQCQASDGHMNAEWGPVVHISIDTTPPQKPQIIEEPPYTSLFENQVYWYPLSEPGMVYQAIASERSDFRSYNTYSDWTTDNHISFKLIKEKAYYFKVKARDHAGNESVWSEPTSTIVDVSAPTIRYFRANRTVISPRLLKDGTLEDAAYIQGGVDDSNIGSTILQVRNSSNATVYQLAIPEKSYLWTHWPEKPSYPDGIYSLNLLVQDLTGKATASDPLFLTIDTTPPKPPLISGIRDNETISKRSTVLSVSCMKNETATIYLGGRLVATVNSNFIKEVTNTEGTHTVEASCLDLAGNKSSKTIHYTVDTTPPQAPSLTYIFDDKHRDISLKLYCKEEGTAEIYEKGTLVKTVICRKQTYAAVTLPIASLPYYSQYTARVSDLAKNWSDLDDLSVLIPAGKQSDSNQKIACSAVYIVEKSAIVTYACTLVPTNLVTYVKTESLGLDSYESTFSVEKLQHPSVTITIKRCKKESFWDPSTWFSCVEEVLETVTTEALATPLFTSRMKIHNVSSNTIAIFHPKEPEINISIQPLITFPLTINGEHSIESFLLSNNSYTFIPKYILPTKGYFTWLFRSNTSVSQWHGMTAYQRPHTGIDFSVYKAPIINIADGVVTSIGFDTGSNCFSGGKYIGIKHNNGLYSYYFHLDSLSQGNKTAKAGQSVKRGDLLAITGNSGYFNCEQLAYHLHFEIRTSSKPSTHLNPIPYFTVNWNTIPTANSKTYPGRLTGENPHPKF